MLKYIGNHGNATPVKFKL